MLDLEYGDITDRIIGAAIKVHKALGPGFLESIYENALVIELRSQGFKVDQQKMLKIQDEGQLVGEHRIDLLVNDLILIENKTVRDFDPVHFSIARSYLAALNLTHGLLLKFARPILQIKRIIRD